MKKNKQLEHIFVFSTAYASAHAQVFGSTTIHWLSCTFSLLTKIFLGDFQNFNNISFNNISTLVVQQRQISRPGGGYSGDCTGWSHTFGVGGYVGGRGSYEVVLWQMICYYYEDEARTKFNHWKLHGKPSGGLAYIATLNRLAYNHFWSLLQCQEVLRWLATYWTRNFWELKCHLLNSHMSDNM